MITQIENHNAKIKKSFAMEAAVIAALEPYGYSVKKFETIILGWGPTITKDYEIIIGPKGSAQARKAI